MLALKMQLNTNEVNDAVELIPDVFNNPHLIEVNMK